ncbi:MAG TPA: preprotein translocase subunit SecA [Alphaproteobacteria bacterium]|nr:preprotein translocase subunit SecA [Alphaproteobacteria bacterium]
MLANFAKSIFGSANDRYIKRLYGQVDKINALESLCAQLSDEALRSRTGLMREWLRNGKTMDEILPEAFATVREASRRSLGMRHFDVQMVGGMVLHQGKIAEMKTGEGKTLVATLAAYLNALEGKGVHVITVNDYLASRDAEWMGRLYKFLGLTVGSIVHGLNDEERRAAYACDITYGTNNEFGFDYLRDNMKFRKEDMVQRPFNFAIVDEVDSILIDEARTPLIISGAASDSSELYKQVNELMKLLEKVDYEYDEKHRTVVLNETGVDKMEESLRARGLIESGNLYDLQNVNINHHVAQALKAHIVFKRDVDYIVRDGKVVIIDEFTGRMRMSNRYSEGLHQALEAKEGVKIEQENQTLASITYQNYFRLFPKLSGMTGTAMTEAAEFGEIYNLDVAEIPTNQNVVRQDHEDLIYRTEKEKYDAIVELIKECVERKQPVLVGTTSIEKSELVSSLLEKQKIKHNVLNARNHEREASIVANAGEPGAVTVATNMAGRGTDIKLGGNLEMMIADAIAKAGENANERERNDIMEMVKARHAKQEERVKEAGGLYVIGTERHESRRIDNQLRGRSGRQGDPGASKFFVALDDDLMRIFGANRMQDMLKNLGLKEGEAIWHPWISKALMNAQKRVEAHHFDIRKNLIKYDDVMNDQRKVIYSQRKTIMSGEGLDDIITDLRHEWIEDNVSEFVPANSYAEQWDMSGLALAVQRVLNIQIPAQQWVAEDGLTEKEMITRLTTQSDAMMNEKLAVLTPEMKMDLQRSVLLQTLDHQWREHLLQMDHMRGGINLRAYGQKDPLNEYKREAFMLFEGMLNQVRDQVTSMLSNLIIASDAVNIPLPESQLRNVKETRLDPALAMADGLDEAMAEAPHTVVHKFDQNDSSTWANTPRNAPCPCGSGKKYKQCHGAI